jgi:hypothetical protein
MASAAAFIFLADIANYRSYVVQAAQAAGIFCLRFD